MNTAVQTLLAAERELPEDVGKSGPLGLLLIVVLLIATVILVRSMSRHLRKLPPSFDPDHAGPEVPDTPAELVDDRTPGNAVLDDLRRRPLAIEPPRDGDGRPEGPGPRR